MLKKTPTYLQWNLYQTFSSLSCIHWDFLKFKGLQGVHIGSLNVQRHCWFKLYEFTNSLYRRISFTIYKKQFFNESQSILEEVI